MANFTPIVVSKPKRNWRKFIIIFVVAAGVVIGGYYLYQYYLKRQAELMHKAQSIGLIAANNSAFLTLSSDSKNLYFLDEFDNTLWKQSLVQMDQEPEEIAKLDFIAEGEEIIDLRWSSDKTKVYITTLSIGTKTYYFDIASKKENLLDDRILDIDFLGDGAIYIFNDDNEKTIAKSNYDGSGWENLKNIGEQYYMLVVSPDSKKVALWGLGEIGQKRLAIYNLETEQLAETEEGIVNFVKFSPDSTKVLYIISDTGRLYISDLAGQKTDLNVTAYLDQFAWADNANIVYVSYAKEKAGNAYNFYKKNIADGKPTKINREGEAELDDPDNMIVIDSGKALFYTTKGEILTLSL